MNQLEKQKQEIAREEKSLEELATVMERLNLKRDEILGKLVDFDTALGAAGKEQSAAVARYARDEITEDQLDGFCAQISRLTGKRKAVAAALEVVESDLATTKEKEKEIQDRIRRMGSAVWVTIGELELSKAAILLRRSFVAFAKSGLLPPPGIQSREAGFLEGRVYDATFCAPGREDIEVAAEKIVDEYLR